MPLLKVSQPLLAEHSLDPTFMLFCSDLMYLMYTSNHSFKSSRLHHIIALKHLVHLFVNALPICLQLVVGRVLPFRVS